MLVLAKRKLEAAYAEQQLPLDNVRIMIDNIMYLRECFAENRPAGSNLHQFLQSVAAGQAQETPADTPAAAGAVPHAAGRGKSGSKLTMTNYLRSRWNIFPEAGFRITTMTRNLHSEPTLRYFETEHEHMFDEMGKKDQVSHCRTGSQCSGRISAGTAAIQ